MSQMSSLTDFNMEGCMNTDQENCKLVQKKR